MPPAATTPAVVVMPPVVAAAPPAASTPNPDDEQAVDIAAPTTRPRQIPPANETRELVMPENLQKKGLPRINVVQGRSSHSRTGRELNHLFNTLKGVYPAGS
jgi:hypothetical protein